MNLLEHKKAQTAGDITMVFWFLFLLILVSIVVVLGVGTVYGQEYDFRQTGAEILNYKITECLKENRLNLYVDNLHDSFFTVCHLDKKVITDNMLVIIRVNGEELPRIKAGRGDETECFLADKNENFPRCTESSLKIDNMKVEIITGSNQRKTAEVV